MGEIPPVKPGQGPTGPAVTAMSSLKVKMYGVEEITIYFQKDAGVVPAGFVKVTGKNGVFYVSQADAAKAEKIKFSLANVDPAAEALKAQTAEGLAILSAAAAGARKIWGAGAPSAKRFGHLPPIPTRGPDEGIPCKTVKFRTLEFVLLAHDGAKVDEVVVGAVRVSVARFDEVLGKIVGEHYPPLKGHTLDDASLWRPKFPNSLNNPDKVAKLFR